MAEALRAETEATEAVRAGKGPWLTLAASCSHKAGSNSSAKWVLRTNHLIVTGRVIFSWLVPRRSPLLLLLLFKEKSERI